MAARTVEDTEEFGDTNEDEEWSFELDAPRCNKTKKLTAMEKRRSFNRKLEKKWLMKEEPMHKGNPWHTFLAVPRDIRSISVEGAKKIYDLSKIEKFREKLSKVCFVEKNPRSLSRPTQKLPRTRC